MSDQEVLSFSLIYKTVYNNFLSGDEGADSTVVFLQLKLSSVLSFLSDEEAAF